MGKSTKKVSWRTLARRAAAATSPRVAAKLRKEAAKLRQKERAASASKPKSAKKGRRIVKKETTARRKPRNDTLKGLAHLTVSEAGAAISQAMAGVNRDGHLNWKVSNVSDPAGNDTANNNVPLTYTPAEHHEAIFKAVEGAVHRSNDNIVCSFIAMYRYGGGHHGPHAPWKVEAETIRALIDVLDRAGYTASGRRNFEKATDNGKISDPAHRG